MSHKTKPQNRIVQQELLPVVAASVPRPLAKPAPSRPFIRIALPPDGCTLKRGTTLTIRMDIPVDASVAKVELFHEEVKVGETVEAPWKFVWTAPQGEFMMIARATLHNGVTHDSQVIVVNVP